MSDDVYPSSTATDVTAVRGIEIPAGHDYKRSESWSWTETNEDGKVTAFLLELTVERNDPEDDDEDE